MHRSYAKHMTLILACVSVGAVVPAGCTDFSEFADDTTVGLNGSFEKHESGLPVNWIVYTPDTVPDSDFDVVLDTVGAKDGVRSLKFDVRACSSIGGWKSPGIAVELDASAGDTLHVSFWIKNNGARFSAKVHGVSAKTGAPAELIVDSRESLGEWTRYEHVYVMPDHEHLRFELSVLAPGTLWVDDVRITAAGNPLN